MLAFLVLANQNGQPLASAEVDRRISRVTQLLPFEPEAILSWTDRSGAIAVRGWQALTRNAGLSSHWYMDVDGGLTAFAGYCWPRDTGWRPSTATSWAEQLATWLQANPIAEAHESLFGFYSIVQLDPAGNGTIATDLLGGGQLFLGERDGLTAISNRAALVALALSSGGEEPERDPVAIGWLLFWGSPLADDSGYWDASRLPFDHAVAFDAGKARIERRPRPYWHSPGSESTGRFEELLDRVDADLRSTLRTISALPVQELDLQLSGGKDPRLLTALLVDEGLADRYRFCTHGVPGQADVIGAELVASTLGLNWIFENRTGVTAEVERARLRRHAFLVEGLMSGWDSAAIPVSSEGASLSGIGGECTVFGSTALAGLGATSIAEIKPLYATKREFDPARLLRPEARNYYHQVVDEWIDALSEQGEEPGRIGMLFLAQHRTRAWSGPTRTVKPNLWLGPFLIPSYIRFAQLLPREQCIPPRVHIELLRRCRRDVSKLPLANDRWAEGAIAHYPDADAYRQIQPIRNDQNVLSGWRTARFEELRPIFHDHLLDRTNPLYDVVDFDAVRNALRREPMDALRLRQLYAAITGAIWLGKAELPVRLNRPGPEDAVLP